MKKEQTRKASHWMLASRFVFVCVCVRARVCWNISLYTEMVKRWTAGEVNYVTFERSTAGERREKRARQKKTKPNKDRQTEWKWGWYRVIKKSHCKSWTVNRKMLEDVLYARRRPNKQSKCCKQYHYTLLLEWNEARTHSTTIHDSNRNEFGMRI